MVSRLRRPVGLPQPRAAVVLPGHRLIPHSGAYRAGLASYACECGVVTPPAPPATAAAMRRDHLGVFMAKNTDPTKFSGEPLANAGRSIIEIVWEEMDVVYGRLMAGDGARAKGDKGRAGGLAYALAVMTNPYKVDVEAIRDQVHARWEAGTDELDTEHYATEGTN